MKNVYFLAFLVLMLSCSAKDQKSNNVPLDWGKSTTDLPGNFVPIGDKIGGCDSYVRVDESYNFEGLTAHSVSYGFCDDQLTVVEVGLFNKDLNKVVEYLTGKYDKPNVSMSEGLVAYKWTKGMMVAVLLYDKNNGKGIDLTMKNIDPNMEMNNMVSDKIGTNKSSITENKIEIVPEEEPCLVETLFDGYNCELWGTPLSEMTGELVKSKNNTPKMDPYDKVGDKMDYEGIKTASITYCFKNGLFQGVNLAMYNKDINRIVKLWTDEYGEPKIVDGAGYFTNYEWHLDGLLLTITYIIKKEDGIGIALGVVCDNDNFKVKKPAVQPQKSTSSGSSATSAKPVAKPATTAAPAKPSATSSSGSDARSSARDRKRDTSATVEEPEVEKAAKVEETKVKVAPKEEPKEEPAEDTGGKSKRELLREKKEKN